MHTSRMTLMSYEANGIVANSWKNPFGGMAKTAETVCSDDRWKETKPVENDHSWKVLSSGTSSGDRAMRIPRVAL